MKKAWRSRYKKKTLILLADKPLVKGKKLDDTIIKE